MKTDDFTNFGQMLVAVGDLYSKTMTEMGITLYFNALKDYDFLAVRQAFDRYVKNPDNGQFMPKPADLIKLLDGTTQDAAIQAWTKVDKAARTIGPYRDVVFDDPIIHAALANIGGWIELGKKTDDEWPFVARDFQNAYKGLKSRIGGVDYDPVMLGLESQANAGKYGLKSDPVLIGDKEKAMQVMKMGTNTRLKTSSLSQIVNEQVKQLNN